MKHCERYILAQPYPKIEKVTPDATIARMLLSSYAGPTGELTAITQYFYNSLLANIAGQPGIAEVFACLAQVEMHHLDLLGQLILAYGGDPGLLYYMDPRRTAWWTGANIAYEKLPIQMLRRSINAEQEAVRSYQKLANNLKNSSAAALIKRIIADEEHHISLFTQNLHTLTQTTNNPSTQQPVVSNRQVLLP